MWLLDLIKRWVQSYQERKRRREYINYINDLERNKYLEQRAKKEEYLTRIDIAKKKRLIKPRPQKTRKQIKHTSIVQQRDGKATDDGSSAVPSFSLPEYQLPKFKL